MKYLVLTSLLALSAQSALASQSLNFDQLRDACLNPAKYHSQIQPTGIKVDCADHQLTWVQEADDAQALPTSRVIGSSVSSDKYTVPMTNAAVALPLIAASCPVFKQVEESISNSQSFTCDQLLAFKGSATDLCQGVTDQMRNENPDAVVRKETGKLVHLCPAAPTDDRGQRGQR